MTLTSARAIYGINTLATPISTNSSGSVQVGANNTTASFPSANVAYSCRAIIAAAADFALDLTDSDTTGSTAWVAGTAQVETNTVTAASGCTSNGTMTLVVTAAGLAGSPLNVPVALTIAEHTTATLIAEEAAIALNATAAVAALFTATSSGADIILTRKAVTSYTVPGGTLNTYAANDATLNLNIPSGLGVTASATSTDTTAGVVTSGAKIYDTGTDFEGETIGTIATLYGVLQSASTGTGVIAGSVDDVAPYSAGSVILMSNANGLPNETALTITATTETDITVTVIGVTA
jgi:hypothetical protein